MTVAAEVTWRSLLRAAVSSANTAVAGWIYQELHGNCGAAYPRQVVADQQRRRHGNDAAHVRKGQWQRSGDVAFDVPRRGLHRRPSVGSSDARPLFAREIKPFSALGFHTWCRWVARALVACASQGPKIFASATDLVRPRCRRVALSIVIHAPSAAGISRHGAV